MKRRCDQYEDEIKRLRREVSSLYFFRQYANASNGSYLCILFLVQLEQKNVTIQQFSIEKDRDKRVQQKIAAKVDKLSKEKENNAKEKQQIEVKTLFRE